MNFNYWFIDLLLRQLIAVRLFNVFFTSVRDYFAKNRVYNLFVEVPLTKTSDSFSTSTLHFASDFFENLILTYGRIRYEVDERY